MKQKLLSCVVICLICIVVFLAWAPKEFHKNLQALLINSTALRTGKFILTPKPSNCHLRSSEYYCEVSNLGCFDLATKPKVEAQIDSLTVDLCVQLCNSKRLFHVGLSNGSTCFCHASVFVHVTRETQCDTKCSGSSENCGGQNATRYLRILSPCLKGPLTKKQIQSRRLGSFETPSPAAGFRPARVYSPEECVERCHKFCHPLAAFSRQEAKCLCGKMTNRFNLQQQTRLGGKSAIEIYRTFTEDERCAKLSFLPERRSHRKIAVTSFPCSGNTWIRYLLQKATGYFSGSIYSDQTLFNSGFLGESLSSLNRTDMISDHIIIPGYARAKVGQTVLIIRNPYEALVADFSRINDGESGINNIENKLESFHDYANRSILLWKKVAVIVATENKPFLAVYYDDLTANPIDVVNNIVLFSANSLLKPEDFKERLNCLSQELYGSYKLDMIALSLNPYSIELCKTIDRVVGEVRTVLNNAGVMRELPKYNNPYLTQL